MSGWRFFIDRGGTFTDCLAIAPDGTRHSTKVLSDKEAPLVAIRRLMQLPADAPIPTCEVRMGTTIATNALLERRGARTLLVITQGFADILEIGTQARPEIFSLRIEKPTGICERVLETPLRADHLGRPLAEEVGSNLLIDLQRAKADGLESVAVVVLNGHAAPALERSIEALAREAGFEHITMSHESANEQGLLKRARTTVIDAYLRPSLTAYFAELNTALGSSQLLVMQSSGSLTTPPRLRGTQALLSGPAGGVVACEALVRRFGLSSAIGFDMGGTSTDVCRVEANKLPRAYEVSVNGISAVSPSLDVHTVAAGGGSVCTYDLGRFQVGPESAGAIPGPACYGAANACSLTVTDVNLLLGRLVDFDFPFALHHRAAEELSAKLLSDVRQRHPEFDSTQMLAGLLRIANTNMAEAIREISLRRGFDVRQETLIVFGGAGGQHACSVARELGLRSLIFPVHAGIFSACGIGAAAHAVQAQQDAGQLGLSHETLLELEPRLERLRQSVGDLSLPCVQELDLRYRGSEARLTVAFERDARSLERRFHDLHEAQFGYSRPDARVEVVTLRVEVTLQAASGDSLGDIETPDGEEPTPRKHARMYTCDGWCDDVPVYARTQVSERTIIRGPACIVDDTGCLVVEPGFSVRSKGGHLLCSDERAPASPRDIHEQHDPDPVTLELMGQAFMSAARQMGVLLQRTASSTNIRERLDYSCAVFDADAALVANAPPIPVHLGAMGETVRHIASVHTPRPGDVFVSNDPAHGGSHLPDITVVTPVFSGNGELRYWVANRGHHSDVGGTTPGSMPAFSSTIAEEGVVLSALPLVQKGKLREDLVALFTQGEYPARNPQQNIQDLEAQTAANHLGAALMLELETRFGSGTVPKYMAFLQDYAAHLTRALVAQLPEQELAFSDALDDGSLLGVSLRRTGDELHIRFVAPPESAGNNNAPRSVTVAAVLYVLRCLLGTRLPLNAGCLRPVWLDIPAPSLLAPHPDRAVCSGNVETSQRVVDVLLGAFGAAAASQGTMNNVTFGNSRFGYYETIAGGAGAGPGFTGADGVHTHMTNTRITDAEILEARYPVRVRRFELRRGSGGSGLLRGGDGCVREYEFLEPMSVTIVAERRLSRPFGLAGGQAAAAGAQFLNGTPLPGRCQFEVQSGDVLRIETPGGGGYGELPRQDS